METALGREQVLYLYGVIPRDQRLPAEAGVAVEAVPHAGVAAVVERVCAHEFSSDSLEEKLQSIDWVARLAQRHQAVLEGAMCHGPVVPARLCTLFRNPTALRLTLAAREQQLLAALQRTQGREEWGLKVFCDEARLQTVAGPTDARLQELQAAIADASPGQAFVLRKQRDARLADVAASRIDAVADETILAVEPASVDQRLRALLPASATGRAEPMVLNLAVLVEVAAREALSATVAQLADRFGAEGFAFEASGPWPPYSFCHDDDAGANDDIAGAMSAEEP